MSEKAKQSGMDVSSLRHTQADAPLRRSDLEENPIRQFEGWFRQACDSADLDPNAMALATVDERNRPFNRTVLLKYFDESGFVFFTNFASKKATQLGNNRNAALLFFWREPGRQVIIRGTAEKISTAETLKYFASRPRGSQIGAWVSHQSSIVSTRSLLEAKFEEIKRKFANNEVPLPSFWGGYRVIPEEFEFWQGRAQRLHDRFQYTRQRDGQFKIERLQP